MATIKTISAALKLIDVKKENLRKAFEDLQARSSSLSSFTLTWTDLDAHFTSIQKSIEERFKELESVEDQSHPSSPEPNQATANICPPPLTPPAEAPINVGTVTVRPELKSFCMKMDGIALRSYIVKRPKEREAIRHEIVEALRLAPDPAELVLRATDGFYRPNSRGDRDHDMCVLRRVCIFLLDQLMVMKPMIKPHVKERAKKLAVEWKEKANTDDEKSLEPLGFLQLLAAFDLVNEFDRNELIDIFVIVARYRQGTELCRTLGFVDKCPEIVQKCIDTGKQLLAVKFISEFGLTEKFPRVPLLKAYVQEAKKLAQKVRKDGDFSLQSQNEATDKEISALKNVVKFIKDHKLENEYPKETLEKRIAGLEKQKSERKRAAASALSAKAKSQQPKGSKRPRTMAPPAPSNPPAVQLGPATGPYGLLGPNPSVASYTGRPAAPLSGVGSISNVATAPYGAASSAGLYGYAGAPTGLPRNQSPITPQLYTVESHVPSGYYDRPTAYSGYGLPPHQYPHSSY